MTTGIKICWNQAASELLILGFSMLISCLCVRFLVYSVLLYLSALLRIVQM
jgi:hypothetical protein